jgi:hypothetical protein
MASQLTENSIAGDIILTRELCKQLKYSAEKTKTILNLTKQGIIAVEILLETAIAKVGKIKRNSTKGMDFEDGTDAKKSTVTINDSKTGRYSISILGIKNKVGALRVAAASPLSNEIYYFIIPNKELKNKSSIKIMFNKDGGPTQSNQINSFSHKCWNQYRVKTFKELCKRID